MGCRAEMTTVRVAAGRDRVAAGLEDAPDDVRPRPTLRRQEFPKQSIWRSEDCWTTLQSTRRTADGGCWATVQGWAVSRVFLRAAPGDRRAAGIAQNSVQYRIREAEEALGGRIDDRRAYLERPASLPMPRQTVLRPVDSGSGRAGAPRLVK